MTAPSRKEKIRAMLAEFPDDPELRYGLAMEYRSEGDFKQARATFEELIRATPDYVASYLQLGQLLLQQGEDEEAAGVLRAGVAAATRTGNQHAAGEMSGLLATL